MSKNEKQIIILTVIGVILAFISSGILAAAIPLIIGFLAYLGDWLYEKEVDKAKTSEQAQRSLHNIKKNFVNSKQATTPACKNILTQRKGFVNNETY